MKKKAKESKIKDNRIYYERITTVFMIALSTVFLLFPGFNGYEGILQSKFAAFCVVCGGYIVVMAVFSVEGAVIGALKLSPPGTWLKNTTWVQRLMLIYLTITWISALASEYFPTTVIGATRFEGALTVSIYVLVFLLVSLFGRVTEKVVWAFAGAAVIFSVISLVQFMGYNPLGLFPEGYNYYDAYKAYSGQYLGTVGNVDLVAAFLCILIPVMLGAIVRSRNKKKYILLVPLILSVFVLVKMSVMAGFAGVGLGLVLSLPVLVELDKKKRLKIAVGAGGLIIAGLLIVFCVDFGGGFLHELHMVLHGKADSGFGSGRLYIWNCVLDAVPSNLILGTGPDTMAFANFEPFSRYDANLGGTIYASIDIAHNDFLNIIYHQGIFAFAAYAAGLVSAAVKWIKYGSSDAAAAVAGTAVLCYCIQAFFGFSVCITAPFFWAALGLLEKRTTGIMRGDIGNEKKTVLS